MTRRAEARCDLKFDSLLRVDNRDLHWAAGEVAYEMEMLRAALRALDEMPDDEVSNLVAEALLLHVRNLLSFFYPANRHSDDIVAEDFASDWRSARPNASTVKFGRYDLRVLRQNLNRRLAHLSHDRPQKDPERNFWDIRAVARDMNELFEMFVQSLPDEMAASFTYRYPSA